MHPKIYFRNSESKIPNSTKKSSKQKHASQLDTPKYIYRKGYKYQKAGIILSKLNDINIYKKNLFSSINGEEKRKKLMKAIDYTNVKYGRHALSIAQTGLRKKWNIKKQYSSKIDTACFDLLPTIKVA